MNGDGSLDLVVGNDGAQSLVHLNDGTGNYYDADINDDRKLDLIIGYSDGPAAVYLNDGQANFPGEPSSHFGLPNAWALATGDMAGNGSLDIVAGYDNGPRGGQNTVYLNDGQGNFAWPGSERKVGGTGHHTHSVAVGDLNGDGALDIEVGNYGYLQGELNYVYLNDGAGHFDGTSSKYELAGDPGNTMSAALGDVNGDGGLDIIVGNAGYYGWQDFVYLNDGSGTFPLGRRLGSGRGTTALALADMNGDGTLDIVAAQPSARDPVTGSIVSHNAVHINYGTGSFPTARDFGTGEDIPAAVAVGDMDGDGLPDMVSEGSGQSSMVTLNRSRRASGQPGGLKLATVARPDGSPDAKYYASPVILENQRIPITYTLDGPVDAPVGPIQLDYSPDGGGRWLPAVAAADPVTTTLAAAPFPSATLTNARVYTYTWDTFASGFFDQSDNVVLRLTAYPSTGVAHNGVPDAHQWPYASASTSPVRVLGTQICVFKETKAISNTVSDAYVFRLPADHVAGAQLLANQTYEASRTNERGYLQGASEVVPSDRLVALWPVTSTYSYTLFYTCAPMTTLGLDAYEVKGPGIQELIVSEKHPLLLFNLDVSLEWDARNDGTFLDDLAGAIKRASEVFYHVSGGSTCAMP